MSSVLSWVGAIAGVIAVVIAAVSLKQSRRSADASEHANRLAAEAGTTADQGNRIARDAAIAAQESAGAARQSAEAANAHIELERAKLAAKLSIRSVPKWSSGAPASSDLLVELQNSGGSLAEDVTVIGITVNDVYSALAEGPYAVSPSEPKTVTLNLQMPVPPGNRLPSFKLSVRYRDETGDWEREINHYAAR